MVINHEKQTQTAKCETITTKTCSKPRAKTKTKKNEWHPESITRALSP